MIQLNLLPDVKAKYIKTERTKRAVILATVVISGVSIGIVLLLSSIVFGAQKYQLSSLDDKINDSSKELQKVQDLDKILTIQNQLNALPDLHSAKPRVERLFTFLPQITPVDVKISDYSLKFEDSTMTFTGTAKDIETVNKFVDTLKFTKFTTDRNATPESAFKEVVLTSFAKSDKITTYTVNLKFNPELFLGQNKTVTLVVPAIISTRSETNRPGSLFTEQPKQEQGAN